MAKLFNYYSKLNENTGIDKSWYQSSNVLYSECIDVEDELKTLKVVFKNGSQYQYEDVDVNDYLLFRDAESQGQALNKIIKKNNYKYTKLDNVDISKIEEEYDFRTNKGVYLLYNNGVLTIKNNIEEILYETDNCDFNIDQLNIINNIINNLGYKSKMLI